MGGKVGAETGVGAVLGGEGNRGEWDERLATWLTEAPRVVIKENQLLTGILVHYSLPRKSKLGPDP